MPDGHADGWYRGARWGCTLDRSSDRRRQWLYAEELGGSGRISFNLYRTAVGPALRPCEMPAAEVIAFVLGFRLTPPVESAASGP